MEPTDFTCSFPKKKTGCVALFISDFYHLDLKYIFQWK